MDSKTILIIAAVIVVLGFIIIMYNSLINKKNQVNNVFASLDALLKKRYDLIPNLVSTVQNYMKHESGTLTTITELRARAMNPEISNDEKVQINNDISRSLKGLNVAFENYPDLKASSNFIQLQQALNETEEQISAGRRAYKAVVTEYNNSVEMFPSNIFASMMKLKVRQLFEITESERQNVSVKNLFG